MLKQGVVLALLLPLCNSSVLRDEDVFAVKRTDFNGNPKWAKDRFGCSSEGTLNTWEPGQSIVLNFTAPPVARIRAYFVAASDAAMFNVYHDGQAVPIRRTAYNHLATAETCQRVEYEWRDMDTGEHSLAFEHAGVDTMGTGPRTAYMRLNKFVLSYDDSTSPVPVPHPPSICPPFPTFSREARIVIGVVGALGLLSLIVNFLILYHKHSSKSPSFPSDRDEGELEDEGTMDQDKETN